MADIKKNNKTTVSFQIDADLYFAYKRVLLEKRSRTTTDLVNYIKRVVEEEGYEEAAEKGVVRPSDDDLGFMMDPNRVDDIE